MCLQYITMDESSDPVWSEDGRLSSHGTLPGTCTFTSSLISIADATGPAGARHRQPGNYATKPANDMIQRHTQS